MDMGDKGARKAREQMDDDDLRQHAVWQDLKAAFEAHGFELPPHLHKQDLFRPKPAGSEAPPNGANNNPGAYTAQLLPTTTIGARARDKLEPREFLDGHNFILVGAANSLSGDGGIGKTDIACSMAIATHPGDTMPLFGLPPRRKGPVLFFSAEEPEAEIRRRIHAICAAQKVNPETLTDLHFIDYSRKEAWLFREDRNGMLVPTPLWEDLKVTAAAIRPALILIDNRARIVHGNQNSATVATSVMTFLDGLAFDTWCAVELLSHVSLSQISSGRGDSGSVAWANAGRARTFFRHPDEKRDVGAEDDGMRVLVAMKTNYGKPGKQVTFQWDPVDNYFRCTWQPPKADAGIGKHDKAERVFLLLLRLHNSQNLHVSASATSGNYAPKLFVGHPKSDGVNRRDFTTAMASLLERGRIANRPYGPPSRGNYRLEVVEQG
jgi:RecA-family ATPase